MNPGSQIYFQLPPIRRVGYMKNARISISYTGVPDETLEELTTDSSGQTDTNNLPAPPIE